MVTYYSRFIHGASAITTLLHRLLCKNTIFKCTSACEAAFLKLKQTIASDQVLMPYDPDLPVQLVCDASPTGIAGVLSHIVDGHEHIIAFASRSLTAAEQNYSQLDRVALAIVFIYLFDCHLKLVTENQPLTRIFNHWASLPKMTAGRLQCYAAFLSVFNYTIDFKKGIENSNVDCLSRAPISMNSYTASAINYEVKQLCNATIEQICVPNVTYQLLKEETKKDVTLSTIMKSLQENSSGSGILFRGQRVVGPASLQSAVLNELHRTHVGITKMKQITRRYVYWKKIDLDVGLLVQRCSECVAIKNSPAKALKDHHFSVVVDAKSTWAEIVPCSSAPTSKSSIEILKDIFSRNGFPKVTVSDNATQLSSLVRNLHNSVKKQVYFRNSVQQDTQQLTSLRNFQTLKHRLADMSNQNMNIHQKVREILFRYRATPLSNGKSPKEQYLNRQIRIQLDAMRRIKFHESPDPTQPARQFSEGERVSARYYSNNKTHRKYGKVLKKLGQLHYLGEFDNGFHFKRCTDQLRSTEVPLPARKTVHFDAQPKSPMSGDRQLNKPNLGDLTEMLDPDVVLPEAEQPDPIEQ
ncbi:hypothetical protein PR048_016074 [Dryococelus australis]|uniref:RNA-directed DNA polymerase n=1 Tax=Dryococelus australis TaxID=614101 RepID=A0ABQ9HIQ1_9NEOP|nr:hypothetical protein PR048_016074 [Dryococelus australis]